MLPAFDPISLFASGEQGAWYDPSDLTTMFQDRAGTTPVTADGQTVGWILDKSKGLVLGAEKITNGTFGTDLTGWSDNITATWDSGAVLLSATSASAQIAQSFTTVVGKTYRLGYQFVSGNTGNSIVRVGTDVNDGSNLNISMGNGSGTYSTHFVATATTTWVTLFVSYPSVSITGKWDNISIKELAGNHATAPSDAARPLKASTGLSDWINYDGGDDVLNTTFASSLGSSCTVARANVGGAPTILTGQTIGTTYADSTDSPALIIVDRALTGQETNDLTAWLTTKGATS